MSLKKFKRPSFYFILFFELVSANRYHSHLTQTYKDINIIVESDVADEIENDLDAVLYTGEFSFIYSIFFFLSQSV